MPQSCKYFHMHMYCAINGCNMFSFKLVPACLNLHLYFSQNHLDQAVFISYCQCHQSASMNMLLGVLHSFDHQVPLCSTEQYPTAQYHFFLLIHFTSFRKQDKADINYLRWSAQVGLEPAYSRM